MGRLSHPNVAVVYEVGTFHGHVFVAMEFVDGVDLRSWLTAQPRPLPDILDLFIAAGRGLAAAHAAGIIHRDFKPENVLVDTEGRPRVTDFGLSRSQRDDDDDPGPAPDPHADPLGTPSHLSTSLTRTGALLGTPWYMAPEQHRGADVDARADQFAFCVAPYEAVSGTRPFTGATPAEIAEAIIARRITASDAEIPRWLRAVLLRGLEPSARDRWPDMETLLAALSRGRVSRRRRWAAGGAAAAALAAVAVAESRRGGGRVPTGPRQGRRDLDRPGARQGARCLPGHESAPGAHRFRPRRASVRRTPLHLDGRSSGGLSRYARPR